MGHKKKDRELLSRDLRALLTPFRLDGSCEFLLKSHDPADKGGFDKDDAHKIIDANRERMRELQNKLYAQNQWSVLLIFQGMDAAGKDSAIEHVMSGFNPQGCQVVSFKQPSSEELGHDFMWRSLVALPGRGRIGIFNRSYYEELLIVRVHPQVLAKERMPPKLVTRRIWQERFEDIAAIEKYLARNGTVILKFFLNVSKDEQRRRFLERLDGPAKNWKFSLADVTERALWNKYQTAYQDVLRHTASRHAPWYVVPADHKWFSRLVISSAIVSALEALDLHFPEADKTSEADIKQVREMLEKEGPKASPVRRKKNVAGT
jgi:PPK2 family polyphosphate:nucleotide phosphotransferase